MQTTLLWRCGDISDVGPGHPGAPDGNPLAPRQTGDRGGSPSAEGEWLLQPIHSDPKKDDGLAPTLFNHGPFSGYAGSSLCLSQGGLCL